jgi:hypothetical protein
VIVASRMPSRRGCDCRVCTRPGPNHHRRAGSRECGPGRDRLVPDLAGGQYRPPRRRVHGEPAEERVAVDQRPEQVGDHGALAGLELRRQHDPGADRGHLVDAIPGRGVVLGEQRGETPRRRDDDRRPVFLVDAAAGFGQHPQLVGFCPDGDLVQVALLRVFGAEVVAGVVVVVVLQFGAGRAVRSGAAGCPDLPAAVFGTAVGVWTPVRPWHWDLAPGRRPVSLTATLRLTTSAMLVLPELRVSGRRKMAEGYPVSGVRVYDRRIVNRFELAINRIRRLFTAFATAAAIGALVGSPAAVANDDPPPPPPEPAPAPADVPEIPREEHCVIQIWDPCEYVTPSPPPPDTPGTPDGP